MNFSGFNDPVNKLALKSGFFLFRKFIVSVLNLFLYTSFTLLYSSANTSLSILIATFMMVFESSSRSIANAVYKALTEAFRVALS